MTTTDLFQQVRIKCIELGITMTELARQLGLNYNYMYQILKGQRSNAQIVSKVKDKLGITD